MALASYRLLSRQVAALAAACVLPALAQMPAPKPAATSPVPGVAAAPATAATPAALAASTPTLGALASTNPFDADRKLWADRIPVPPPPPPPQPPPPVTDDDLLVYATFVVGDVKRANVKLGKRFASANPANRPFVTLQPGHQLGEWVVQNIEQNRVLLAWGAQTQAIGFGKKNDRAGGLQAAAAPPPVQGASAVAEAAAPAAPPSAAPPYANQPPGAAGTPAGLPGAMPGTAPGGAPGPAPAQAAAPAPGQVDPLANAPPGSLAAAIAAARDAAMRQNQGSAAPTAPVPFVNPFAPR